MFVSCVCFSFKTNLPWASWVTINQHTRVEDSGGIQRGLGRAQGRREHVGTLPVVPRAVIAAYRVVVGDGAAMACDRLGNGRFDLVPLRQHRLGVVSIALAKDVWVAAHQFVRDPGGDIVEFVALRGGSDV